MWKNPRARARFQRRWIPSFLEARGIYAYTGERAVRARIALGFHVAFAVPRRMDTPVMGYGYEGPRPRRFSPRDFNRERWKLPWLNRRWRGEGISRTKLRLSRQVLEVPRLRYSYISIGLLQQRPNTHNFAKFNDNRTRIYCYGLVRFMLGGKFPLDRMTGEILFGRED